ncbi:MAG: hypothetical protein AAF827_14580 [Cyanobacteria bacterium P01_D01_bin.6]
MPNPVGRPPGQPWKMVRVPIQYASATQVRELIALLELTLEYKGLSENASQTSPRWEKFREFLAKAVEKSPCFLDDEAPF